MVNPRTPHSYLELYKEKWSRNVLISDTNKLLWKEREEGVKRFVRDKVAIQWKAGSDPPDAV